MKSDQQVISKVKSRLVLAIHSMMGMWEAENFNETKKIDKLSKIGEQFQSVVVDLNHGPNRKHSVPISKTPFIKAL